MKFITSLVVLLAISSFIFAREVMTEERTTLKVSTSSKTTQVAQTIGGDLGERVGGHIGENVGGRAGGAVGGLAGKAGG